MVAPLVFIGAGVVVGAGAIWAALRGTINPKKPVMSKKGNPARILTAKRVSPDGCPLVAAIHCGDTGEMIGIYGRKGGYGGTLWRRSEISMGTLEFDARRDLSDLINTPRPVLPPLSSTAANGAQPQARLPLDFSRPLKTAQTTGLRSWRKTGSIPRATGSSPWSSASGSTWTRWETLRSN